MEIFEHAKKEKKFWTPMEQREMLAKIENKPDTVVREILRKSFNRVVVTSANTTRLSNVKNVDIVIEILKKRFQLTED